MRAMLLDRADGQNGDEAAGDAGGYSVRVSNGVGLATSASATLTVNAGAAGSAPVISKQPATLVVAPGGSATLAVAASGKPV